MHMPPWRSPSPPPGVFSGHLIGSTTFSSEAVGWAPGSLFVTLVGMAATGVEAAVMPPLVAASSSGVAAPMQPIAKCDSSSRQMAPPIGDEKRAIDRRSLQLIRTDMAHSFGVDAEQAAALIGREPEERPASRVGSSWLFRKQRPVQRGCHTPNR